MATYEWALDNDYDVYIERLPTGLTLSCFLATSAGQTATGVSPGLTVTPVYGTYDIPAVLDADGNEVVPARPAVSCYKAPFEGADLTAYGNVGVPLYLLLREGQNLRVYAEVVLRDKRPATVVG